MYGKNDLIDSLSLLNDLLDQSGKMVSLVVCGGAALSITDAVIRTTKDVDVIALLENNLIINAKPLPDYVIDAFLPLS